MKRQKARECQAKNLYPHTLSRMGYEGLKKDIKLKANVDGSIENPPSPPRHELWKLARKKKSGEYTSEPTTSVAEKIVSTYSLVIVILFIYNVLTISYTWFL